MVPGGTFSTFSWHTRRNFFSVRSVFNFALPVIHQLRLPGRPRHLSIARVIYLYLFNLSNGPSPSRRTGKLPYADLSPSLSLGPFTLSLEAIDGLALCCENWRILIATLFSPSISFAVLIGVAPPTASAASTSSAANASAASRALSSMSSSSRAPGVAGVVSTVVHLSLFPYFYI